ncbi:MAG: hypothetical protein HYV97_16405 [Bdellovibrio sp.]|nr:hypothetical protein [Bdellovibrio sp.]
MCLKKKFIIILAFFSCNFTALAAVPQWGLGAVIGDPTGLSLNYFMHETRSLHSVLAFDFSDGDEVNFASHYIWWKRFADMPLKPFRWFYGFGGEIAIFDQSYKKFHDKDIELGPSATLGLSYAFESAPLEAFLKSNLTLDIVQETDVDMDLMLGLHFNF